MNALTMVSQPSSLKQIYHLVFFHYLFTVIFHSRIKRPPVLHNQKFPEVSIWLPMSFVQDFIMEAS